MSRGVLGGNDAAAYKENLATTMSGAVSRAVLTVQPHHARIVESKWPRT